jgi:hypothetical protein
MTANCFPIFFGYTSLYAFLVTIACSQLEKLRASVLNIRQKQDTTEQDSGTETDQEEEGGPVHNSQQIFRHMQKQLNDCVRHHQGILRYVNQALWLKYEFLYDFSCMIHRLHTFNETPSAIYYISFSVKTGPLYVEGVNTMSDTVFQ